MKPAGSLYVEAYMEVNDVRCSKTNAPLNFFVEIPPLHQGVADALRTAFTPPHNKLPEDLTELLAKLA